MPHRACRQKLGCCFQAIPLETFISMFSLSPISAGHFITLCCWYIQLSHFTLLRTNVDRNCFSPVIHEYVSIFFQFLFWLLQVLCFSSFNEGGMHIIHDYSFSPTCLFFINLCEIKQGHTLQGI